MNNLLESLNNLSPEKRALLALRLKSKGAAASRVQKISRRESNDSIPLSYAQQRLWFIWKMEPTSAADNIAVALRIKGRLDVQAMEQTFSEIIKRHEILRTNFPEVDGLPTQRVNPAQALRMPIEDLSGLDEANREAEAEKLISAEESRPFDLVNGAMLRAGLIKMGEQEHLLLLTMHHIVSDGWSMGILVREVGTLYDAFTKGNPSPLSELPIQYADYSVWQRAQLSGATLDAQLDYWKQQLAGASPTLELPTDHARPAVPTSRGRAINFVLPSSVTEAVRELSRTERTTLFMTLMAAFKVLLYRYTGQADIVIGTPYANRNVEELEGLIGVFLNTLVMRTDMSGNPSFRELLGRVKKIAIEGYAHQEVPFEKLVEVLKPDRNLSRTPLFQVMFAFHNWEQESLELTELDERSIRREATTAKYDLTLEMTEYAGNILGMLQYKSDLFDESTMARMVEHFQRLVESAVSKPDQSISAVQMLSPPEQQLLLEQWSSAPADYQTDQRLHELFEQQAARTPDAIAVSFEQEQVSYTELNARANQLAHQLQSLNVRPEVTVGVLMERSVEMVVALLGVLKAGGAYLPLDPAYPVERLRFMLEDAAAPVLLTQAALAALLPTASAHVLSLDDAETAATLDTRHRHNPQADVLSDSPAYIIYTSGSTGQPKGVVIPHRAIANHMRWMLERFPLRASDRVLQKTPFSFDASVWEFYAPLLVGAQLVMARPGGHRDGAYLTSVMAEQEVTILQVVPSLLSVLIEEEGLRECRSLRRVFCGGEALTAQLVRAFRERAHSAGMDVELVNLYGPTEACIDATYWVSESTATEDTRDEETAAAGGWSVPIGRPVANLQAYVLDEQMGVVAVGVTGELYLGGAGLARGYLNRAELTAEKFVPQPYAGDGGARLYRTGDLVKYRADGELEYVGRADYQVKVRGFRIELGEVEAALREYAAVKECVVVVRGEAGVSQQLVAYVVAEWKPAPTGHELRAHLTEVLPEHMVPHGYMMVEELPLLANGKVDRASLPEAEGVRAEYVAPRTEVEATIADIWQEMLGLEKVGVHDNFFDLGGHSLLLVQVCSKLRTAYKPDLSMVEMFNHPTVSALAKYLREEETEQPSLENVRERAAKQKQAMSRQKKLAGSRK
nr:condensation domain-containing protein [uncultured bacterium]